MIGICALTGTTCASKPLAVVSLDDWDMRSDRNTIGAPFQIGYSLDDWDMRSDRNSFSALAFRRVSLDDWDMRSDRNASPMPLQSPYESR